MKRYETASEKNCLLVDGVKIHNASKFSLIASGPVEVLYRGWLSSTNFFKFHSFRDVEILEYGQLYQQALLQESEEFGKTRI